TVELAKRAGLGRLAPVANGLLRQAQRRREGLAASAGSLGLRHSLPDWLARLLLQWRPADQAEAFAMACNQAPA
ncbi:16S rRNA (cytosine(967)-C(5))-methyltransferase, partial [Aphanothece stagnina RSMan2012]